jgi:hypothetical protein
MKISPFVCAAIVAALMPAAAFADDRNDPTMRNSEARARDRETTRNLNQQALSRARARDAGYAEGWRAYKNKPAADAAYARDRAQYDRQMAAWRSAVAACRAGDYSACDN